VTSDETHSLDLVKLILQEDAAMRPTSGCDSLFLPVWIVATVAAFGVPEPATAETAEGETVQAIRSLPGPCGSQGMAGNGLLTLFIQPPAGTTMRLTYSPNEGWRSSRAAGGTTQVAAIANEAASQPGVETQLDQPMTVFIDGPSGYTYFWIPDMGWKFVGRLTDRIE
jgi:hypothetical protein